MSAPYIPQPILPLAPVTVCSLSVCRSVSSPWQCVHALLTNSLRAGAQCVAVRLDLRPANMRLQVIDDGWGLSVEDLGVVGRQSWSGWPQEGRGLMLAGIRRVARLVKVTSRREGETAQVW